MSGSVERIEQELAAMREAIASFADEFYNAYSDYLTQLGQAVRQQLILTSYQVCTQGYPDRFLSLPYNQRFELQQTLRRLANQIQDELLAQLHPPAVQVETEAATLVDSSLPAEEQFPDVNADASNSLPVKLEKPQLTPIHLAHWQQDLEMAIAQELRTASHAANRLLQQAGILPMKLPELVLEAAAKVDASETGGQTPNLMNLLIETEGNDAVEKEDSEEPKEHSVVHILAIHLRLAEVEFSNPSVNSARTRIRSLQARLKTMAREYQKKQRERTIAEAQAAWRSSWTDD